MTQKVQLADYWVLGTGKDCDGCNSGHVASFSNLDEAHEYADSQNEWSDGICYKVTSSLNLLREYCNDYNLSWVDYIYL